MSKTPTPTVRPNRIPTPHGVMLFLYLPAVADTALSTASFADTRYLEFTSGSTTMFDAAGIICGRFDRTVIAGWALIGAPKPA